ncbi:2-amino-4-hydroxy-6-hydroxymethyldihydropteridine diphosphokinase [SAR202 cluster bacterium AC-409-J13_OGT_754m]|nr:2-amino-4-hydroxy-6-hydroxymethyldihydropteridine diphosphokinase [SAR202 cluster bacterium AC-409-J13_OGT_754m]
MDRIEVYIGIGSNLGDRMVNIVNGLTLLGRKIQIKQMSSIYETVPVGFVNQPVFLNCVFGGTTYLSPKDLLSFLKEIEGLMGRTETFQGGPRVFDADILFYGKTVLESHSLTIPHPGIKARAFVLIPLCEIACELLHPGLGKTALELLEELKDTNGVVFHSQPPTIDIIPSQKC